MSCQNIAAPLQLPLTNVTISSDGLVTWRGIEVGIGTPQQIVSLQISMMENDIFVGNAAGCNETEAFCAAWYAGIYDFSASDSYNRVTQSQWNGTSDDETLGAVNGNWIFFTEHVAYGPDGFADGVPMYMNDIQIESSKQGGLPLGPNSTFLQASYDGGFAPSTAYGLFYGSRSIEHPEDGMLVLGGYDQGRIDGNLTDLPYYSEWPASFEVSLIEYETENGTETVLDEPMRVWIESYVELMTVPQDAWERFRDFSGATYDPDTGYLVMPDEGGSLGNLTVTLSNGFKSSIPPHELFSRTRGVDDDGQIYIEDPERTHAVVVNGTSFDREIGAIWGYPFLAQTYMVVDHAREEFRIGTARKAIDATRDSMVDGAVITSDIQSICALDDGSSSGGGSGANAGAIAGGVIGGVGGLALIIFVFWLLRRRKVKKSAAAGGGDQNKGPAEMDEQLPPAYQPGGDIPKGGPNLGQSPAMAEMSVEGDPRFSMSEMQSPEQANGGGFVAKQTKPMELEAPLPEEAATMGKSTSRKEPVELP